MGLISIDNPCLNQLLYMGLKNSYFLNSILFYIYKLALFCTEALLPSICFLKYPHIIFLIIVLIHYPSLLGGWVLKSSCVLLDPLQGSSCVLSTYSHHSLYTFLLSDTTKCSSFTFYFPCLQDPVSHLSKEPRFL